MDEMTTMFQRIRTLALQSANGTNSAKDRKALQEEVTQLCSEIDRIAKDTTFGGENILNGEAVAANDLSITNATDAADYLVGKGVPFRDAHGIVGQLVLYGIEHGKALDDFTMEEYKAISPVFEEDIYEAISMETCVNKRLTKGAPGREAMLKTIITYKEYLSKM